MVTVKGGGDSSQAGAIRLGIAHALLDYGDETSVKDAAENEGTATLHKLLRSGWFIDIVMPV